MPIYNFVTNGGPAVFVVEKELSCLREAKYQAIEFLWERLRDISGEFWTKQSVKVFVTDAWHVKLLVLKLDLADVPEPSLSCVD